VEVMVVKPAFPEATVEPSVQQERDWRVDLCRLRIVDEGFL
jgi:hypothetical protein